MTEYFPVVNPLKQLRLSKRLSQEVLAHRAGVTRQLVIRAEQGVYASPPPRLLDYLLEVASLPCALDVDTNGIPHDPPLIPTPVEVLGLDDEGVVYHRYAQFQTYTRKHNFGKLMPKFNFAPVSEGGLVPEGEHPFTSWRMQSGLKARIGTAKYFCVHPALLHKFEVTPNLCRTVPGELITALGQAGYSSETLAGLENAYYSYKKYLSRQFELAQVH